MYTSSQTIEEQNEKKVKAGANVSICGLLLKFHLPPSPYFPQTIEEHMKVYCANVGAWFTSIACLLPKWCSKPYYNQVNLPG